MISPVHTIKYPWEKVKHQQFLRNWIILNIFFYSLFFFICRDFRPQNLEKSQERFRLRLYEIYAWGFPLIIAGIAAILDMTPDDPNSKFLRPKFAKNSCWFHGKLFHSTRNNIAVITIRKSKSQVQFYSCSFCQELFQVLPLFKTGSPVIVNGAFKNVHTTSILLFAFMYIHTYIYLPIFHHNNIIFIKIRVLITFTFATKKKKEVTTIKIEVNGP